MKNNSLSQLDKDQISKRMYQEDMDAQRVVLVGGGDIKVNIDTSGIESALRNAVSNIEVKLPEIKKEEKEVREKTVFLPQIQTIEKPLVVKELEIREIQSPPTVIKEVVIKEIEKPVIVKELEVKEISIPSAPIVVKEIEIREIEIGRASCRERVSSPV